MNNHIAISPKYQMDLIDKIQKNIWDKYKTYKKAELYVKKFQEEYWNGNILNGVSFEIIHNHRKNIDLEKTLHNMDGNTLIKMAIDLEIETPDFIPAFPIFKNVIKESHKNLKQIFNNALKNIEEDPALSISNSNAALESLLKDIIKSQDSSSYKSGDTLYKLTGQVLKIFNIHPSSNQEKEIKQLGSALLSATQAIENLRSNKTSVHGKVREDLLIDDSLYSYFIINSVATIGLYINSFYKKILRNPNSQKDNIILDEIPS